MSGGNSKIWGTKALAPAPFGEVEHADAMQHSV